ncbi:MAG: hypothetical protein EHM45_13060 [Desulfobacteraceae bacterium]|nr:MAG: hypothetical protein EHM45_13060 [Desulfobacteraceae bacterium]
MKYCQTRHQRHSIRLKSYDYAQPGAYFITLCTHKQACLFGRIENGEMQLNEYGLIAKNQWEQLRKQFLDLGLGEFVVMPNHIHGIIIIKGMQNEINIETKLVGAGLAPAQPLSDAGQPQGLPLQRKTIGDIVGAYKSITANACLKIFKSKNKTMGKLWQRNYYEHIIRNEQSYHEIAGYIINNPAQWDLDELYARGNV